jgi:glycosyltransferase involved in cell wall biosynthesis
MSFDLAMNLGQIAVGLRRQRHSWSSPLAQREPAALPKRFALVTDAWHPQVNGVVNTLSRLVKRLEARGTEVLVVSPDAHHTVPLPSYPEIRIACDPWRAIPRLRGFAPEAIHVATEGPLGAWTSMWLQQRGLRFTTSFHTRFPEYLKARVPCSLEFGYTLERWFHGRAEHTLVGTQSLIRELRARGVGQRLVHWPRGVDTTRFHPDFRHDAVYADLPRPIWLYVGRLASEKSLPDFLELDLPGTKVVVGDGPCRAELEQRHPDVVFRGFRFGDELSAHYASADCFVFPSRTETFGNVLLEAHASGLPIAALPAPGPSDLVDEGVTGSVGDDLRAACIRALRCSRDAARKNALRYTLDASHEVFSSHLVPLWRDALRFGPAPSAQTQKWFAHAQRCTLPHRRGELAAGRREGDDRGPVLEPTDLLALAKRSVAGDDVGAAVPQMQAHVEEMQPDARHEDGRDRHERERHAVREPSTQHRAFVLAEQAIDAPERDRVHVPGLAFDVAHLLDAAVMRRMKAVIHAGTQPQGYVDAVAEGTRELVVVDQLRQRVGEPLGLDQLGAGDRAARADDRVAGADEHAGILGDGPRAIAQRAHEAVVQAAEARLPGVRQVYVGEKTKERERRIAYDWLFDRAQAAHQAREQFARDAVGQQEIEIVLLQGGEERGSQCHGAAE